MRRRSCLQGTVAFALVASGLLVSGRANAHNGSTHKAMTETAYDVMVAAEHFHDKTTLPESLRSVFTSLSSDPEMKAFLDALAAAAPKLRSLPVGLPNPYSWDCYDPEFAAKTGSTKTKWSANPMDNLAAIPLGDVPYAIDSDYLTGTDCGVDTTWDPGVVWRDLLGKNPVIITKPPVADFQSGDHTGTALGVWSIGPDNELNDIHMTLRTSNAGALGYLKKWIETIAGAGAGTVWVPVKCGLKCGAAFLWPPLAAECKKCIESAVNDGKNATHEGVTEIDGLLWNEGDIQNANFTGIPHHVNPPGAKPFGGIWAVPNDSYDDQWGLIVDRAGPTSLPDPIEFVTMAASDMVGLSFLAEKSGAIQNYQIATSADGHAATVHRDNNEWEYLSWPHVAMTPVDNLGMFGWMELEGYAKKGRSKRACRSIRRKSLIASVGVSTRSATRPCRCTRRARSGGVIVPSRTRCRISRNLSSAAPRSSRPRAWSSPCSRAGSCGERPCWRGERPIPARSTFRYATS